MESGNECEELITEESGDKLEYISGCVVKKYKHSWRDDQANRKVGNTGFFGTIKISHTSSKIDDGERNNDKYIVPNSVDKLQNFALMLITILL